jgi:hypothetical protein
MRQAWRLDRGHSGHHNRKAADAFAGREDRFSRRNRRTITDHEELNYRDSDIGRCGVFVRPSRGKWSLGRKSLARATSR